MTDLRQQLEADLSAALHSWCLDWASDLGHDVHDHDEMVQRRLMPVVESALAAARQETAQRIEASVLRCKFGGETDLARSAILATVMDAIRAALARETGEQQ